MLKKIFYFLVLSFLSSCNGSNIKEEVKTTDSAATGIVSTSVDTVKTIIPTPEDSIKRSEAEFEKLYTQVIKTLKTPEALDDINNYLDPEQGLFIIYNPGAITTCTILQSTHDLDDSEGSPVIDFLTSFGKDMANAKDRNLALQYSDQINIPLCEFNKRGTFVLSMDKPKPFLSKAFKQTQEMIGADLDQAELKKYLDIEKKLSKEVIINSFERDGEKYGKILYFTKKNNQWYLSGMNLADCGAA